MHKKIIIGAFISTTIFLAVTFFVWTIIPARQMVSFTQAFRDLRKGDTTRLFKNEEKIFYPFNSIQPELRYQFIDYIFRDFMANPNQDISEVLEFAIEKLEDGLKKNDDYANHVLALGKGYDLKANLGLGDESFRKKAEIQLEKALTIFPDNQQIAFAHAINIANQGRTGGAIKLIQEIYEKEPRIPETNFYYGALLYMQDNIANADESLPYFEYSLDRNVNPIPPLTDTIYKKMLAQYYQLQDTERLLVVVKRLVIIDPVQANAYQTIATHIEEQGTIPVLNLLQQDV